MFSYLSDVVDHLEEARDDSGRLAEKCMGTLEAMARNSCTAAFNVDGLL